MFECVVAQRDGLSEHLSQSRAMNGSLLQIFSDERKSRWKTHLKFGYTPSAMHVAIILT